MGCCILPNHLLTVVISPSLTASFFCVVSVCIKTALECNAHKIDGRAFSVCFRLHLNFTPQFIKLYWSTIVSEKIPDVISVAFPFENCGSIGVEPQTTHNAITTKHLNISRILSCFILL